MGIVIFMVGFAVFTWVSEVVFYSLKEAIKKELKGSE
jgi:H+/gluconate symporter-like permease